MTLETITSVQILSVQLQTIKREDEVIPCPSTILTNLNM